MNPERSFRIGPTVGTMMLSVMRATILAAAAQSLSESS
jgi:hypothetical protein